jgi:hypothetical protein
MMQGDREFGPFLRRSLHAAAESIAVGEDGLEKIRSRLAEVRRAALAGRGEPLGVHAHTLQQPAPGRNGGAAAPGRVTPARVRYGEYVTSGSAGTRT